MKKASVSRIEQDMKHLVETVGLRLAGSAGDRAAMEYIADRFAMAADETAIEEFPVICRDVKTEVLEIKLGGKWVEFPASLFGSAPGTHGKTLSGDIVFFAPESDFQRPDLSFLTGKAVVFWGTHIEKPVYYKRLMDAKPAFLLMTDTRYPAGVPLADGLFPAYVREFGAIPTMNVAFLDVVRWFDEKASAARLKITGGLRPSVSGNVVATLYGSDPDAGILYAGGHHDTQAGSAGADDNAMGVVTMLEIARVLAKEPRRRTIKLISFGAEEQLSVGSAEFVRKHRKEVETQGRFMVNVDSASSKVGWNNILFQSDVRAEKLFETIAHRQDYYYRTGHELCPYGDHFPFCAAGVPALWFLRENCATGRYFHHRPDDDLSKVSYEIMAQVVNVTAEFLLTAANAPRLPFAGKMPEKVRAATEKCWRDLFGGWKGLKPMPANLLEK